MKILKSLLVISSAFGASCYDGDNGGCSHICSGEGVCSCPDCWELDDSGKKCKISSGKAKVTCSTNGVSLVIDKCVVPDVPAASIHLNDDSCSAVAEGDAAWKIDVSSINGCGAKPTLDNNVLSFANALHIGNRVVSNFHLGRSAEVGFVCNYNTQATATSSFVPSNEKASVSFDAGDVNDAVLDFTLQFSFYETNKYVTSIDYSTHSTAVGNTLFGKINAPATIPDTTLVVNKCSVSDSNVSGAELDLVENNCPIDNGLGFLFGEESATEVKFQFTSFLFPQSSNDAELSITCDVNFCSSEDTDCLAKCNTEPSVNILYLAPDIMGVHSLSKTQSGDYKKSYPLINYPEKLSNFAEEAQFAVIFDILHLFGGKSDPTKVFYLVGCDVRDTGHRFTNNYGVYSTAVAVDDGETALICADNDVGNSCESYDGSNVYLMYSTGKSHRSGRLGHYKGQTVILGSGDSEDGELIVDIEKLEPTGWANSNLKMPAKLMDHSVIDLKSGALLVIGGYEAEPVAAPSKAVWLLADDSWSKIGTLEESFAGSALRIENFIYLFNGYYADSNGKFPVQRVLIDDADDFVATDVISHQASYSRTPPIFQVDAGFCEN